MMMTPTKRIHSRDHAPHRAFFPLLIWVMLACGASGPTAEKPEIAVSVFPVYDIARTIAGDRLTVSAIVPAGANPHIYEPPPSAVRALQNARLYIGISSGFDGWAARFVPTTAKTVYLLNDDTANPHIWLSVRGARAIADGIAAAYCAIDPANRPAYEKNLAAYRARIDDLHRDIEAALKPVRGKSFIQWHASWDYFAAEYGLVIAGTIESGHGHKPSLRAFGDLIAAGRRMSARAVIIDLNAQSAEARTIAEALSVPIIRLDAIGDPATPSRATYLSLMRHNATALAAALSR